ncbi:phage lysin [Escherichia coli]|nr:phage lysin [Escherichia coli]
MIVTDWTGSRKSSPTTVTTRSHMADRRRCLTVAVKKSTASGRYQQLYLFWRITANSLPCRIQSRCHRDRLAIQLIHERGALDDIRAGRIERAISRCRNIWASLPGAGYGQREHSLEKLVTVWRTAGGVPA